MRHLRELQPYLPLLGARDTVDSTAYYPVQPAIAKSLMTSNKPFADALRWAKGMFLPAIT